MNIIDIDQDFFWNIKDIKKAKGQIIYKEDLIKTFSFEKLVNIFNLNNKIPYKIFINHDEVYYHIRNQNYNNIHLIHLDRHDDLDRKEYNVHHITAGNWLSYLIRDGLCNHLDWIHNNRQQSHTSEKSEDGCLYNIEHIKSYAWDKSKSIDYIFFTISPEFIGDNSEFDSFINFMKEIETNMKYL